MTDNDSHLVSNDNSTNFFDLTHIDSASHHFDVDYNINATQASVPPSSFTQNYFRNYTPQSPEPSRQPFYHHKPNNHDSRLNQYFDPLNSLVSVLDSNTPVSPLTRTARSSLDRPNVKRHKSSPPVTHNDNMNNPNNTQKNVTAETKEQDQEPTTPKTLQHHSTLSLNMVNYLERLEDQILDMKSFISKGYRQMQMDDGTADEVEQFRFNARNYNASNVTELDELLQLLVSSDNKIPENGVPVCGMEIKGLSHSQIDNLLDIYYLPFRPSMFLYEKRMIYLRFIGANRVLMHRILD